jgi:oligoribonuclease NrnB/cAMP/cGMP phosphodiesterase (DHH superfamily)
MNQYNVFYHYPCNDGELAKVIWETKYPESNFYAWDHKDIDKSIEILTTLSNKISIVFLDVCPSITLLSDDYNYIIIDHHENAVNTMKQNIELLKKNNITLYYDFKKSGCMLTWDYCYDIEMPQMVKYIGSKDIWDFSDVNTEPYSLGYSSYLAIDIGLKFTMIFILLQKPDYYLHNVFIKNGNNIIEEYRAEVKQYFNSYSLTTECIDNISYNIIDIVCSNNNIYKYLIEYAISQVKNYDADVLRILHTNNINKTYSLRSLKDNIRVDGIARFYGGNGHPKAAGYTEKL